MIFWYADNSDLRGIWEAEIPDILIFGGILVDEKGRDALCSIMHNIKLPYGAGGGFPLKWNFRSLEEVFNKRKIASLYPSLLRDSVNWRTEIFRKSADVDFTCIVSIIKCHGKDRAVLKSTREAVTRYAFSNALMRVGLFIKELKPNRAEIVLDWPSEGQRGLYDDEYRSAFRQGVTADNRMSYFCGSLDKLGFSDAMFYSGTQECSLLQFSDMIVGAMKETVEEALDKKSGLLGPTLLKLIRNKFRGAPSPIGRGISLAPTSGSCFNILRSNLAAILFS